MNVNIVYIIIVIAVVLVSMTLHEAMHAYVGYWLGDTTAKDNGRLTLNPIKHLDPFLSVLLPVMLALVGAPVFGGAKPVPFDPENVKWGDWGVALVALAGPLTNFLLAFLSFAVWVLVMPSSDLINQIFSVAVYVNLGFFIFNLIPIPPLDGSRVLYALAPDFVRQIMRGMEKYGVIIVLAIVLIASSFVMQFMSASMDFFFNFFCTIFGV